MQAPTASGAQQGPEVGAIGDPERRDDQMTPTTVAGPAALAPKLTSRCLRPAHAIEPDRLLPSRHALHTSVGNFLLCSLTAAGIAMGLLAAARGQLTLARRVL
jgi:hypothetical protein